MAGSGTAHMREDADTLLSVRNLVVEYRLRSGATVHAVSDVSLDILPGETVGLVGESGCGKSTLGRAIAMLRRPTEGTIDFGGVRLTDQHGKQLRLHRRRLQMIFQDPISSLNPRRKVREIIAEGARIWGLDDSDARIREILEAVGLDPDSAQNRKPYEFSGGQCQRIAIGRCLILEPDLIVCDEPVSALDVSVQAQILNLLADMKDRFGLTLLFIAHDLAVVREVSDRVVVMYLGKICEVATSDRLYEHPAHPYSAALMQAVPVPDPDAELIEMQISGDVPSPLAPPSGCRFRTRCPRAQPRCAEEEPVLTEVGVGQYVACHYPLIDEPVVVHHRRAAPADAELTRPTDDLPREPTEQYEVYP